MSMSVDMEIKSKGLMAATVTKKDIAYLKQNPDVVSVEVDETLHVLGERDPVGNLRKLAEEVPYGISMVLQDVAFFNGLGTPAGSIKVCVADTGYGLGHIDLPNGNDVTGTDSSSNGAWNYDGHGHGTHCSGTISAKSGNNEGVVGVIPNNAGGKFQLVIGKALSDSGSGSNSAVLEAVQSCVDKGAKVISLSLGGGSYSQATDNFYKDLYEKNDILFVAAAGNGGSSEYSYPASYSSLMSVAAIDSNKNKASFSQFNDQVEISGPGVAVTSTVSNPTTPPNSYATWSGTSMATPHIAGVAGLLWMHFPACKNYQIRNVLAYTAMDLGTSGCDTSYGHGLVQAKAAYNLLAQGNCGGSIGQVAPIGGCQQLQPPCTSNSQCNDGDECTTDTCGANGLCTYTPKCSNCGKSEVKVDITTDNYGSETSFTIKNSAGSTLMSGSGYGSNTAYTKSQCFSAGSYTFTISDSYGDGMCCSYGSGSYSVKLNGVSIASGGSFGSSESKPFVVSTLPTSAPITPPISAPVTPPTPAPTSPPTPAPTRPPTPVPTTPPTSTPVTNYPTHTTPTMYPTHTVPTPFPTHVTPTLYPISTPPTPFPTQVAPTPFPTEAPPTLFPTSSVVKRT